MYKVVHKSRRQLVAALASTTLIASLAVVAAAPAQAAVKNTPLPAGPQSAPAAVPAAVEEEEGSEFSALLFTKTAAFRHSSIDVAVPALEAMAQEEGFTLDATEDATVFNDEDLANYDVVIWLSTTGNVLEEDQQAAFERYIQNGGGYAGVHAASDTEYAWEWYGDLVGAYFQGHPPGTSDAEIVVEDHAHPSTAHLGDRWEHHDEWYAFESNPRNDVHVLMSLDEKTYSGGNMGADHPFAWCQDYDGGRAWYTAGGHTNEAYSDPTFTEHLLQGIRTAAGVELADCNASLSDAYELVQLADDTENPMSLTVTEDGTIFYLERKGELHRIDPATQENTDALVLDVTNGHEDGLLGMVLDPDFETNNWAYIYYSPRLPDAADGPHNRISRFTYDPASGTFDPASESLVLKVETQREECCHAGGDMVFDLDGNLVLATGDNTNPFASSGYSPIDEREGRSSWDAQRTAGNTNDLRGKVLRITPEDDGGYAVPAGNLFDEEADTDDKTRPEIYAMGLRNPFRIGLDPHTGNILVGDYGPDANGPSSTRGPAATTEWNIIDEPGNYGWPYCHGVKCYNDFNFANSESGDTFDPNALVNDSPNNTGLTNLPAVITPEYYGERGASDNPWTQVGQNGYTGAPMGGPAYKFDEDLDSDTKFPAYWDGKAFLGDWNDGDAFAVSLNHRDEESPGTEINAITPLLPGLISDNPDFQQVMDASWGPEGSLYVIDWGTGYGTNNADSGIYRIDYVEGNPSPVARASADITSAEGAPMTVQFSSEGTRHPANVDYTLAWDFGDGGTSTEENPEHTYTEVGKYTAQLTVTDADDRTAVANVTIVVGNAAPTVTIEFPERGGFFNWGDEVEYKVTVTDPDGEVNCDNVKVLPALGHAAHQHPVGELSGCEGAIPTSRDDGHGITEDLFWVVDVSYIDDGGEIGEPLSAVSTNILNPKRLEAEFFDATGKLEGFPETDTNGVEIEDNSDLDRGQNLSYVEPGDWWSYDPVNFKGIEGVRARLAVPEGGTGSMTIHWNAPDGDQIGEIAFGETGAWQEYDYFESALDDLPTESGALYFVLREGQVNVNYFEWLGDGVDGDSAPLIEFAADPVSGTAPLVVNATASATDPEGEEVTLQWDQGTGDGFVEGTEAAQYTYDTPGKYMLRVRAVQENGIFSEESVQINVTHEVALCFDGRSDDFTGDQLDTERWDRAVRLNQEASVSDGELIIPASTTDIHQNTNDATNIVLQDMPDGAWEATTKVTFPARDTYQQAGLIVYGGDDDYAKMVVQARGSASAENRVFQFANETGGTAVEENTANLGAEYPDTVYVRLTSDGTTLSASYSSDGQNFTAMSETHQIDGLDDPRIGLMAFANGSSTATVVDAHFDWFYITPDDTAGGQGPDDEFDGDLLDGCRWTVENEDQDAYRVVDGALEIDPAAADMYEGATGVTNFVVQDIAGDWTVETKVDASELSHQYQQAGLIVRADDDNYVKIDFVARNSVGSALDVSTEMLSEIDGAVTAAGSPGPGSDDGIMWLRLTKTGDVITGSTSTDGETWVDFADEFTNPAAAAGKVGLFALGTDNQTETPTVQFDYFRVDTGDVSPVELDVTVSPAEPDGSADWYTSAVTVDATATGGSGATVYREININEEGWSEFTAPVEISTDGEHTVGIRAWDSDSDADAVEETVSFKIDATAPTVEADAKTSTHPRTLTVSGEDEGSGIDTIQYRIGTGSWTNYTTKVNLSDAAQTVAARATDTAGNVSETVTVKVPAYDDGGDGGDGGDGSDLTFKDVKAGQTQFYNQIMWLANQGISRGWITPSGHEFRPFEDINRDAMAAFLYRYAGSPNVTLPSKSPFRDVTPSTQFYKEIVWMSQEGISNGWKTSKGHEFRPYEPIARDAMAAFLYRYADRPAWTPPKKSPFGDVTPSTQFYKEITWMHNTGISTGWTQYSKPQFRPYDTTNRDAMAAFLYRYNQVVGR